MKTPYEILGVALGTPIDECKKAYRKLSKRYHPDNVTGDANKFDEVQKAWTAIENGTFDVSSYIVKRSGLKHQTLFTFV